jgi:hypothetical protein
MCVHPKPLLFMQTNVTTAYQPLVQICYSADTARGTVSDASATVDFPRLLENKSQPLMSAHVQ